MVEQLSMFSILAPKKAGVDAICCMDNERSVAIPAEQWMKEIIPAGEYTLSIAGHPLVLRPAKVSQKDIQEGHEFYHYLIGGRLYSGIFVGRDSE